MVMIGMVGMVLGVDERLVMDMDWWRCVVDVGWGLWLWLWRLDEIGLDDGKAVAVATK